MSPLIEHIRLPVTILCMSEIQRVVICLKLHIFLTTRIIGISARSSASEISSPWLCGGTKV